MIKKLAAVLLVLAVAAPAMAAIVPASPHNYVWKEFFTYDGDQLDAYMEVERGDFIELVIVANFYQGQPANIDMTVSWDPNAMDVGIHISNGWHWAVYASGWSWMCPPSASTIPPLTLASGT